MTDDTTVEVLDSGNEAEGGNEVSGNDLDNLVFGEGNEEFSQENADAMQGSDSTNLLDAQDAEQAAANEKEQARAAIPEKYMVQNEAGDMVPDVDKLAAGYDALQKKLGQGADLPEDANGYDLEDFGDVVTDENNYDELKKGALEQGLTNKQLNWMMGQYRNEVTNLFPSMEAGNTALRSEWGEDFDGNMQQAKAALEVFGDGLNIANNPSLSNNPAFIQLLANIGAELSEDTAPNDSDVSATAGITEEQIDALISSDDYWDNRHKQKTVSDYYNAQAKRNGS